MNDHPETRKGVYFALIAYSFWGVAPVYFKWVDQVSPWEILSHRVIWALVMLLGILAYTGQLRELLVPRGKLPRLLITSLLLSCNWLLFIYAVVNNNITETSLGYFINPLVSVFLGMIFLGERLRPLQWIAIVVASTGIVYQLIVYGEIPWLGLSLAFTFGFYGLVRKNLNMHPIAGLTIETIIVVPFAAAYLLWAGSSGSLDFGSTWSISLLLILGGFVTSFPLLCFNAAVTRLSLTAIGMFQYVAPSMSLILAVFLYNEPFTSAQFVTFGCIWLALCVFTVEALNHHRRITRRQLLS